MKTILFVVTYEYKSLDFAKCGLIKQNVAAKSQLIRKVKILFGFIKYLFGWKLVGSGFESLPSAPL